ncbi:MAG TPA: SHOCT domain-containing protein [Streptosporangiaceae bacterium]|nr:SHOCT domain-containing protein [Streptosporangiaceae bacterium]
MRRRPLLRAAAVGGGAYVAGKRAANRQAEQEQAWAQQDARISELEDRQAAAAPAAQPAAGPATEAGMPMSDQLSRLADLHSQGILSDDEFAAAKAKLLGV